MEIQDMVGMVTSLIDSLGTVGILIAAWLWERKRADVATALIVADWSRQNDRDADSDK